MHETGKGKSPMNDFFESPIIGLTAQISSFGIFGGGNAAIAAHECFSVTYIEVIINWQNQSRSNWWAFTHLPFEMLDSILIVAREVVPSVHD